MLLFYVVPVVLAALKHYPVKRLLTAYDLYPLFLIELLHLIFQISSFAGNTSFIAYASILKTAVYVAMLLPILRRRLYLPALAGAGSTLVGSLLNRLVLQTNAGKMPVWPTLSERTGYCTRAMLLSGVDSVHVLMTPASHLRFLGDYIDLGWCILSPGDLLNHLFVALVLYYSIRSFTKSESCRAGQPGDDR